MSLLSLLTFFFTFLSSCPKPLCKFQPNLGTKHPLGKSSFFYYEILSKTNAQNKSAYTEKRTLKKMIFRDSIRSKWRCLFHVSIDYINESNNLTMRRLISITVYYTCIITFMWSTSHQSVSSLPFNTITNCSIAVLENNVFKDFFPVHSHTEFWTSPETPI